MNEPIDHRVRELGSTRLQLRGDLIFTPRTEGAEPYYLVEDPMTSRFFRIGVQEYAFISLFDGRTPIQEALRRLSSVMPNHRLSDHDAAGICRWLVEQDLAHTAESARADRLAESAEATDNRLLAERWNPLVMRLPIGKPDRVFAALAGKLGWVHGPWFLLVWLALVGIGVYQVFAHADRFAACSGGLFAPGNWLWLAACWIGLKVIHETAHGTACRYYGGEVREMGILFIVLAPLAYVDVTSSWRFRSRWARIHVAAAGMIAELLVAALAALVWSHTPSGWLNYLGFNVVIMAGLTALLFNANPLMKFDGYYILSDLLGIPNLYVSGQQYVRNVARRVFFGADASLPPWPRRHAVVIRIYGIAAFAWRILVCAGLTIAAAALFRGAGIVLAGLGIVLWLGLPAARLAKHLVFGEPGQRPRRLRFLLVTGPGVACCAVFLLLVPWPGATQAPAVVEYAPYTIVRAGSAGFVEQILVEGGQEVEAGQPVAVLSNPELDGQLAGIEVGIRQCEIRCRQLELQRKLAECQAQTKKHEALLQQRTEKKQEVEQLTVRAPCRGAIVPRDLESLLGTYMEVGDEIVTIGTEPAKELRISIAQDDLDVFVERVGRPLRVDMPGRGSIRTTLSRVIPRAALQPTHAALAAVNGGPLPVKNVSTPDTGTSGHEYELLAPRFTGIGGLTETESTRLRAGEVGTVAYRPCSESIGVHLYGVLTRWVRERFKRTMTRRSAA